MIPLDDWMILEKEERKVDGNLIVPDSARDKTIVEVGDIFIVRKMGEDAKKRLKEGDRCLFYGIGSITGIKLQNGKLVWVGRAADVIFTLEEGE
jgi:co-chaperonin GroES (HSP10)